MRRYFVYKYASNELVAQAFTAQLAIKLIVTVVTIRCGCSTCCQRHNAAARLPGGGVAHATLDMAGRHMVGSRFDVTSLVVKEEVGLKLA